MCADTVKKNMFHELVALCSNLQLKETLLRLSLELSLLVISTDHFSFFLFLVVFCCEAPCNICSIQLQYK